MNERNGRPISSHTASSRAWGTWGNAPWTPREVTIISYRFMLIAVSWRKMAMVAGTMATTAERCGQVEGSA